MSERDGDQLSPHSPADVLPFPPEHSGSMAGRTMQESVHDGWLASAIGPRLPTDMPEKVAQMKEIFLIEAAKNKALPHRRWPLGPGDPPRATHRAAEHRVGVQRPHHADAGVQRTRAGQQAEHGHDRPGHPGECKRGTDALGGSGGLNCYLRDGFLCYEYNLFIVMRTKIHAETKLPIARTRIEVLTQYAVPKPGGALEITLSVNDVIAAKGNVPVSAPLLFTANDCLDIGTCLGPPVSLDYYDEAPFPFNGHIERMHVTYTS